LNPTSRTAESSGAVHDQVDECNGDLSPTSPTFRLAPEGSLPVPHLHPLIAIEVDAELCIVFFGKFEAE
jgi:hypothetical protein